jgi:hypothetical protein
MGQLPGRIKVYTLRLLERGGPKQSLLGSFYPTHHVGGASPQAVEKFHHLIDGNAPLIMGRAHPLAILRMIEGTDVVEHSEFTARQNYLRLH